MPQLCSKNDLLPFLLSIGQQWQYSFECSGVNHLFHLISCYPHKVRAIFLPQSHGSRKNMCFHNKLLYPLVYFNSRQPYPSIEELLPSNYEWLFVGVCEICRRVCSYYPGLNPRSEMAFDSSTCSLLINLELSNVVIPHVNPQPYSRCPLRGLPFQ